MELAQKLLSFSSYRNSSGTLREVKDWKREVTESTKPSMVLFHTTWCGYCKAMTPEWMKAVPQNDKVNWYAVDCDKNASLAQQENVQSFPLIVGYSKNASKKFSGKRDAAGLLQFSKTL